MHPNTYQVCLEVIAPLTRFVCAHRDHAHRAGNAKTLNMTRGILLHINICCAPPYGRTNAAKKRPKIPPPMAALHGPIYVVGERNHPHTTSCSRQTAPCMHTAALSGVLVDFMDMRVRYAVSGNHSPLYTNVCKLHVFFFFFCKVAEHEQMAQLWVCSPKMSSNGQQAWRMRL